MSTNQALKRLGFRRDRDYRLMQRIDRDAETGAIVATREELTWLSDRPQPDRAAIDAAAAEVAARAYRKGRKAAYIARLGEDGTFEETVGDVLDAVIRQTELNRLAAGAVSDPDFAAKVETIDAIKREFPKPKEGD